MSDIRLWKSGPTFLVGRHSKETDHTTDSYSRLQNNNNQPKHILCIMTSLSSLPKSDEPPIVALESVQWSNFFEDDSGKAQGVFGIECKQLSSKHLWTICSCLSIKGVKNFKKSDMRTRRPIVLCSTGPEPRRSHQESRCNAHFASLMCCFLTILLVTLPILGILH